MTFPNRHHRFDGETSGGISHATFLVYERAEGQSNLLRLVCYTAVFSVVSEEERCVTTLKTAV